MTREERIRALAGQMTAMNAVQRFWTGRTYQESVDTAIDDAGCELIEAARIIDAIDALPVPPLATPCKACDGKRGYWSGEKRKVWRECGDCCNGTGKASND